MFQYIAAGLGAATLLLGAVTLHQRGTINDLEADVATLEGRVADKDSIIDRQNAGIAAMVETSEKADKVIRAAGERIDALSNDLAAERAKRRAARESDNALPDCTKLLEVDLAAVCPARARGLRDAAANR